ncbi:SMP-30/gluconolactonase/LRE family protein [Blastopirellula sp. JC732]|uniref:SMP-30/gluconolactonase/LRE family protein n=1 Tax=Blastopirellula sediminis TaxID=2894196 RepID=A0A9X1MM50_9BACT|nr:alpha/beta hydrolase-fold protein [Blastopirellula sediminis]MCC9608361.1 SMP-30/gluconolactonase/LRE family protein [Blastopirellula sediminis]MCC9628862.1 SMP-30/gluconolactonase/LRE family protein [Blastopirellula sediminis]
MHRPFQRFLFACLALAPLAVPAQAEESPDRVVQPGVPQGKITSGKFEESKIFPGTVRDYSVYVPAQYDPNQPAALMVFMDGGGFANPKGAYRVPVVFDNLIHQKAMPVTIAVFVNPGTIPPTIPGGKPLSNRSYEYDSMGDRYATFLIDEFLPVALKGLNVSTDPAQRAVSGGSSGGICAFTVAWERPDQFGKVLSNIGSYTNIRGGWAYPGLIRKTKDNPKGLKVYLQDGVNDLSNLHGSWPLGNHDMAAALQFAGYPYKLVFTDGGHSGKWAGEVLPEALKWLWDDNAESTNVPIVNTKPQWEPHPDAILQEGVPQGTVHQMKPWESKIFPGTVRDWSIYVPAQYKADEPAALMVFQDGEKMRDVKGRWRVPTVFDNLIARGDMPPTIAVFINPGQDKTKEAKNGKFSNRGYEYDSLGDRYVTFLTEEILPEVRKQYNITDDPNLHAIGGSSSGAICAFTAAWERDDVFRKVYSSVGSFTNLRGGNVYPSLVRKTEQKPIRVYMADTSGDVDNAFGSWPWANQRMSSALKYMGYDHRFDWAEGYAHNSDFGGAHFPDAMKWLWRKEAYTPEINTKDDLGSDFTLLNLLVPGEGWELVAENLGFADALCADKEGNLYYCDMKAPSIVRISAADGSQTEIAQESVSGLEFNPEGTVLYGCQGSKNRVISINLKSGEIKTVAEGVKPNDLAVTKDGFILITETGAKQVTRINPETGEVTPVDVGISKPNGIALSNDGGTLAVSDYGGDHTWTFRVNPGGVLDAKQSTMPMRLAIDPKGEFKFNEAPPYVASSRGDGMAIDKAGRYYVTSDLGVQVFDPTCRPCGVLPKVDKGQPLTTCMLAGKDHSTLYIAHGTKIYRRKLTVEK